MPIRDAVGVAGDPHGAAMTRPQTLRVGGLDELPTLVPHLVGFHPDDSLVLIGLRGERSRVVVTVRVDLPPPDEPLGEALLRTQPALAGLAHTDVDEVILVVYPHLRDDPWAHGGAVRPLPHEDLLGELAAVFAEVGVGVRDMVCVGRGRQTSYLCRNEQCCPPEGRAIDREQATLVEATLVGAGSAPLERRGDLVARLAARPDDDPVLLAVRRASEGAFVRLTAGLLERTDRFVADLRAWWRRPADEVARTRLVATVGHLVTTIPSRDLLMRGLTVEADHQLLKPAREVLAEAVRCAAPGDVAPLAAVLAVCCWVDGDGASAWVALDRALADDPGYSLAGLVAEALTQGQPPWIWTSVMSALSVEEILAGGRRDPGRSPA
jgi:hypothetical protein